MATPHPVDRGVGWGGYLTPREGGVVTTSGLFILAWSLCSMRFGGTFFFFFFGGGGEKGGAETSNFRGK